MKEIVAFTRPYENKSVYVEVTYDTTNRIYELKGIDAFGNNIKDTAKNYNYIMHMFYREICWMLDQDTMALTAIQRTFPNTSAKDKRPKKSDLIII